MAGRGRAPKTDRQNASDVPLRGEWQSSSSVGWQHGEIPPVPTGGKSAAARATWASWFGAWFAAHWAPEDLPNLELVIQLWARARAGKATGSERSELRQLMDSYGITKKGQQDRRWSPPSAAAQPLAGTPDPEKPSRYGHLRSVG